jgi:SulP family sulfate permease
VQLALTLTFMVGIMQLAMGLARMGTLVNFISHSVVIGFTAGAAILIASKQLGTFFGVELPRGLHFHEALAAFAVRLDEVNPYVTAVGLATVVTGILVRRYLRKFPYMIAALLVGSLIAWALSAEFAETGITTIGALPAALPPLSLPDFSLATIKQLAPAALAATLLALTEAVSIARALASRSGQRLDGNQEFVGQGLSNLVGSFFSSFVATGSFNRSGVNYEAGARTPLAAAMAGVLLIGMMPFVAPVAAWLPHAAMAGLLFLVAWGLIDFHHIHQVIRASRAETVVMGATFFATLLLDLEFAILLGVMLSLGIYLSRTSRPRILSRVPNPHNPKRAFTTDPSLPECPQFKIIRIDGSLFFGAVDYVERSMQDVDSRNPEQKHLMVVAKGINFVDLAGAELLAKEAERRRKLGGGLYLYEVKDTVCSILHNSDFIRSIGDENIFDSKTKAVEAIVHEHLDPERCRRCSVRIFRDCAQMPDDARPATVAG